MEKDGLYFCKAVGVLLVEQWSSFLLWSVFRAAVLHMSVPLLCFT